MMKTGITLVLVMLLGSSMLFAQVGINDDGSSPNSSAGLDVKFSNKGFLLPRLTLTQRNGIATPSEGLMVYCTDCGTNGSVSVYSGGAWRTFSFCTCATPAAGTNQVSIGQITWTWNAVPEATGYKWNTVNDYSAALDMGSSLTKTETGTTCNATYTRYVWAYNACAVSLPVILSETTPAATSTPTAGTHVATMTQITWNWNAVAGASGYRWSSVNNYAAATDMGSSTSKTEGSLVCQTSYTRYAWAYNSCGYSTPLTMIQSTLSCSACVELLNINHVTAGGVAPVNKSVTYATVTNIPGEPAKCWITSNLGSSHQATAVNDTTEASAGWYWQFNLKQGYKYYGSVRTPSTNWLFITQNSSWLPENDPCNLELGTTWRIPTYTEWNNVFTGGSWTNWNGPWNSGLKMHAGGHIDYNQGWLYNRGVDGYYWSSSQVDQTTAWTLGFWNSYCGMYSTVYKANGYSIRCLKN